MRNPKAVSAATNKYQAKSYDRITMLVKKGEKDRIKAHAEAHGESVNAYINRLIREDMKEPQADG